MQKTEAQILSLAFERARGFTRWYTSKLKECDPMQIFEANGKALNSLYWLNAHLAWAEDFLILGGTGAKRVGIDWLESFSINSDPSVAMGPAFKEVLDTQKAIHELAMAHFVGLSDDALAENNTYNFSFGGSTDVRGILIHAITHESIHAGHIGWLCKIQGAATI